jgi:hypothetical protein
MGSGIFRPAIRRFARGGVVKGISGLIYEETCSSHRRKLMILCGLCNSGFI